MIATVVDLTEHRFCAQLDRRVRAAELEEGVAELNATLGRVSPRKSTGSACARPRSFGRSPVRA